MAHFPKKSSTSTPPTIKEIRDAAVSRAEQEYLKDLVALAGSDLGVARRISGLSRSRLYGLLSKYGIKTNPIAQD